jgi:DNA-binding CsgD family transcriptional regulator
MAVAAMRVGASDFVEKVHDAELLIASIERTLANDHRLKSLGSEQQLLNQRAAELSPRRREVMDLVTAGISRKQIAVRLGISHRTVEVYRAWIMERIDASNVAELARKVLVLDEGRFRWGSTALQLRAAGRHRREPNSHSSKRSWQNCCIAPLVDSVAAPMEPHAPTGSDRP